MSQFISLQDAIDMTKTYRENRESILNSNYQNQNLLAISETFDREVFDSVLGQDGCRSLRIYLGMSSQLQVHAIIVGVDGDNNDQLPGAGDFKIIETGIRCPPDCVQASVLNPGVVF